MREMGLIDINHRRDIHMRHKSTAIIHTIKKDTPKPGSVFYFYFLSNLAFGFDSIDFFRGKLCTEAVSGFFNRVCN